MRLKVRCSVRLELIFHPSRWDAEMATALNSGLSTRDRLERAREAAPRVAELSTVQKNALLFAMADAIEAHAQDILTANENDLELSGLEGAMRDRLLLTSDRIVGMAAGVRDV